VVELAIEIAAKVACALALVAGTLPGHPLPHLTGTPAKTVATAPSATYPAGALTAAQVAGYVRRAGFPEALVPELVAIAERESGFCPRAVNGQGCVGTFTVGGPACSLWQLFPCPGPQAADPMAATWMAREKCLADVAAGYDCLTPWGG
jgi:hypothetical protein